MGPDTHQTGAAERAVLSAFRQSSLNEERYELPHKMMCVYHTNTNM